MSIHNSNDCHQHHMKELWMPDELMHVLFQILGTMDAKTLLISIPQVCRRYRRLCQGLKDVHLDLTWCRSVGTPQPSLLSPTPVPVPVEALVGWDSMLARDNQFVSGLTQLFPSISIVTFGWNVSVAGSLVMALGKTCTGITTFQMSNGLTDDALMIEFARECCKLTTVDLSCSELTDADIVGVANARHELINIDLSACKVTDTSLLALGKKCHRIVAARFGECCQLTDDGVTALAEGCPDLSIVDFWMCNVTDTAVLALVNNCSKLSSVNFGESPFVTALSLQSLAENCSELTDIDFGSCKQLWISEAVMQLLVKGCPKIKSVRFDDSGLTDASVLILIEGCAELVSANLSYNKEVTDKSVRTWVASKSCHEIKTVGLSGTSITDDTLIMLGRNCPGITNVDFSGCKKITDAGVIALADGCPKLLKDPYFYEHFQMCTNVTDDVFVALTTP